MADAGFVTWFQHIPLSNTQSNSLKTFDPVRRSPDSIDRPCLWTPWSMFPSNEPRGARNKPSPILTSTPGTHCSTWLRTSLNSRRPKFLMETASLWLLAQRHRLTHESVDPLSHGIKTGPTSAAGLPPALAVYNQSVTTISYSPIDMLQV